MQVLLLMHLLYSLNVTQFSKLPVICVLCSFDTISQTLLCSILRIPADTRLDLLVIDEAVMVVGAIASDLMTKFAHEALYRLLTLASTARQVIVLDAYLDTTEARVFVDLLARAMGAAPYWIRNDFVRRGEEGSTKRVTVTAPSATTDCTPTLAKQYRDAAIAKVVAKAESGKKVVFLSNTRSVVDACFDAVSAKSPNLQIARYTSASAPTDADGAVVGPEFWGDYDVLMYSPAVVAGISFAMLHFDCMVAYFENGRSQPGVFTCLQMLGRVRRLRDDETHVYLCARQKLLDNLPTTWSGVEKWLDSSLAHETASFCAADVHFMPRPLGFGVCQLGRYDKECPSFPLIVALMLSANACALNFGTMITQHFVDTKYEVRKETLEVMLACRPYKKSPIAVTEFVPFRNIVALTEERYRNMQRAEGPAALEDLSSMAMFRAACKWGVDLDWIGGSAELPSAESFYTKCVAVADADALRKRLERLTIVCATSSPDATAAMVAQRMRALTASPGQDANFLKVHSCNVRYGNLLVHGHAVLHAVVGTGAVEEMLKGAPSNAKVTVR